MSACNIGDPTSAPRRTAKPQTESPAVFLYVRLQVVGHRSVAPPHDWSCYQHSTPNRSLQYAFWLAPIRVLGPMTGAATDTRHQMPASGQARPLSFWFMHRYFDHILGFHWGCPAAHGRSLHTLPGNDKCDTVGVATSYTNVGVSLIRVGLDVGRKGQPPTMR